MTTRNTVLDGEDTQPLDVTRDREMNVPEGGRELPEDPVERLKDDLMQDEEDTDGNV